MLNEFTASFICKQCDQLLAEISDIPRVRYGYVESVHTCVVCKKSTRLRTFVIYSQEVQKSEILDTLLNKYWHAPLLVKFC
jgi:RNase P subunit RPR2